MLAVAPIHLCQLGSSQAGRPELPYLRSTWLGLPGFRSTWPSYFVSIVEIQTVGSDSTHYQVFFRVQTIFPLCMYMHRSSLVYICVYIYIHLSTVRDPSVHTYSGRAGGRPPTRWRDTWGWRAGARAGGSVSGQADARPSAYKRAVTS